MVLESKADWALAIGGKSLSSLLPLWELIIGEASLYFHFQMFTDCAALAVTYQPPEETLDRAGGSDDRYASVELPGGMVREASQWVQTSMVGIYVIAGFCLMMSLFHLQKLFQDDIAFSTPPSE